MPFLFSFSAEPASFLYILTGAASFAYAGFRKSTKASDSPSTPVFFCRKEARDQLKSLDLL